MDIWKLQDAKARFSEVVDRALHDGPQVVTRHGENTVVIVAYREFIGQSRRKISRIS
jgi:antitoxin Phd